MKNQDYLSLNKNLFFFPPQDVQLLLQPVCSWTGVRVCSIYNLCSQSVLAAELTEAFPNPQQLNYQSVQQPDHSSSSSCCCCCSQPGTRLCPARVSLCWFNEIGISCVIVLCWFGFDNRLRSVSQSHKIFTFRSRRDAKVACHVGFGGGIYFKLDLF